MMKLLCRFSLVLLGAFSSLGESIAQVDSRPPNILLIVGDDMGYADVGFHGCTDIPTPHLDSLARSGDWGGADGGKHRGTEARRKAGDGGKEFIWWSGRVGERSSFELFSLLELAESFASKRDRLV